MPDSAGGLTKLGLATLVYGLATVLRGWRWHRLLLHAGVPHERFDAFALVPVTYMGNTVLPARAGEVIRVVLLSRAGGARKRDVLGTVIAERVLDALVLAALLVVLGSVGIAQTAAGTWPTLVAAGGLAVALAAGTLLLAVRGHPRVAPLATRLAPFLRSSAALYGRLGLLLTPVTVAVWVLEGLVFSLVADSLRLDINVLEGLVLVVLSSFLTLIPAAPAYAGTFDAAILLGLRAFDVRGGDAVGYTLLVRAVLFIPVTIAGLLLVVVRYGGLRSVRREAANADLV